MRRTGRYLSILAAAAIVVALQLALCASGKAKYLPDITMAAYHALVVIGLCLLMGYAGQVSMGHAGFVAIGGYASATLTTCNLMPWREVPIVACSQKLGLLSQRTDLYGQLTLSFTPAAAFVVAMLAAGLIALAIGAPLIRLKGHYLAMATLGFGLIVLCIVQAAEVFGQADGISGVPPFHLGCGLQVNGRMPYRVQNYYIAWTIVLAAMLLSLHLVDSRVGRALRSIHQNEEAAHFLGINTYRYKLATFVLSALFAAIGGVFLTHYKEYIAPRDNTVMESVRYVAIVAVGGMDNLWGALGMGVLLNFLSLRHVFKTYDQAVFGAVLILIMLFAPHGLLRIPNLRSAWTWIAWRSRA